MSAYDACVLYTAIKLHFTPGNKYDFFKFCGKVKNITPENFEIRPDRWFFHKLSKTYPHKEDLTFFFAANFFVGGNLWVRDLLGTEADQRYQEKLRIKESIQYLVTGEITTLLEGDFPQTLKVTDGQFPVLLDMVQRGEILEETLLALDAAIGLLPVWKTKIRDTILFPAIHHRLVAYRPFLTFDIKKLRELVKNSLDKPAK